MSDTANYDVVVAGGGLAGCFAAIAAAREGARTALVEQYGFLGGTATTAPVAVFMQYHVAGQGKEIHPLVGGLFAEMVERLRGESAMLETPFSFDDMVLRGILDDLLGEAGVEVYFHCTLMQAATKRERVSEALFCTKGGLLRLGAKVFVDATGDGDLMAMSGAPFTIGREKDGRVQPLTSTFCLAGVDAATLTDGGRRSLAEVRREVNRCLREAHAAGQASVSGVGFWPTPRADMLFFNTSHVWVESPLSVRELSQAEIEGRRQVRAIVGDLQRFAPGFAQAYVARAGVHIGVRESRRLMGRYTLSREDIVTGRHFTDGIARCAYEIDIHGLEPGEATEHVVLERGVYYEVPYRCLTPAAGPENLLVACRALSASHEALGSVRIMPTLAAIGEAAGLACVRALPGGQVACVDGAALKAELLRRLIMPPVPDEARVVG